VVLEENDARTLPTFVCQFKAVEELDINRTLKLHSPTRNPNISLQFMLHFTFAKLVLFDGEYLGGVDVDAKEYET
jgi:hypothetical protein